jgi:hypothetical protein
VKLAPGAKGSFGGSEAFVHGHPGMVREIITGASLEFVTLTLACRVFPTYIGPNSTDGGSKARTVG